MKLFLVLTVFLCGVTSFFITNAATIPKLDACGKTTRYKQTQMVTPYVIPPVCTYTVRAYNTRITQLRIDFNLIVDQPTVALNGIPTCSKGSLSIAYQQFKFTTCGSSHQQHIYVPFNVTSTANSMDLVIKSGSSSMWNIFVTQLDPTASTDKMKISPNGCLQYFYDDIGEIQSFNYNGGNGPYLPNDDYTMCFKTGGSGNELRLTSDFFEIGQLNGLNDTDINADVTTTETTIGKNMEENVVLAQRIEKSWTSFVDEQSGFDEDCYNGDSLTIIGTKTGVDKPYATQFCGQSLKKGTVLSAIQSGPLMINFHSDGIYDNSTEKGFRFEYSIL